MPRNLTVPLMTIIALLVSPLLQAHPGVHGATGFADGFMHPATGPDHLLVAIGAGYWAAHTGRHSMQVIILFLSLLLGGILLGLAGRVWLSGEEVATALLFILPALVIAVAIGWHRIFSYVFFGAFALYHGAMHILEKPHTAPVLTYAAGLLLSTGVLLAIGVILRQVIITRRPDTVPRG